MFRSSSTAALKLALAISLITALGCNKPDYHASHSQSSQVVFTSETLQSFQATLPHIESAEDALSAATDIRAGELRCRFLIQSADRVPFEDPDTAKAALRLIPSTAGICGRARLEIIRAALPQASRDLKTLARFHADMITALASCDCHEEPEDRDLKKGLINALLLYVERGTPDSQLIRSLDTIAATLYNHGSPQLVRNYLDRNGAVKSYQEGEYLLRIVLPDEDSPPEVHSLARAVMAQTLALTDSSFELDRLERAVPAGESYASIRTAIDAKRQ